MRTWNVVVSYKIKGYALVDVTGRELLSGKCKPTECFGPLSLQKGVLLQKTSNRKGFCRKETIGK